jgi:undecaprenyl-diphosphatase
MIRWDHQLERWIAGHRVGSLDWLFKDLSWIGTGVAIADVGAGLVYETIKALVQRPRPHVSRIVALPHSSSFPSGHATSSFACAVVIGALVPRLRGAVLILAVLIAYSRLYVGVHYPLDVLAGAGLGLLVGLATVTKL